MSSDLTKRVVTAAGFTILLATLVGTSASRLGDRLKLGFLQGSDLTIVLSAIAAGLGTIYGASYILKGIEGGEAIEVQEPIESEHPHPWSAPVQSAIAATTLSAEPLYIQEAKQLSLGMIRASLQETGTPHDPRTQGTISLALHLMDSVQGISHDRSNQESHPVLGSPAPEHQPESPLPVSSPEPEQSFEPQPQPAIAEPDVWDESEPESDDFWSQRPKLPNSSDRPAKTGHQQEVAQNDRVRADLHADLHCVN